MAVTHEAALQSSSRTNGHADRKFESMSSLQAVWSNHNDCPVAELALWRRELLSLLHEGPQLDDDIRRRSAERYFDTLAMLGPAENAWQRAVFSTTIAFVVRGTRINVGRYGLATSEKPYTQQMADSFDDLAVSSENEPVRRMRLLWLLGMAADYEGTAGVGEIAAHCKRVGNCIAAFHDSASGRELVLGDGPLELLLRERLSYHAEPARGTSATPATRRTRLCRLWCGSDVWTAGGTLRVAIVAICSLIILASLTYGVANWRRVERFRNENIRLFEVNSALSGAQ
jgi:hypothetical protein